MDCEICKEKRKVISQTPKDVPYIIHEGAVARLERVIKRMWVVVLSLIIFLFDVPLCRAYRQSAHMSFHQ